MGVAHLSWYLLRDEPVELCPGRRRFSVEVANTGDRPIQVGSHYPFDRVNRALRFDRALCAGTRLDIPAGTAMRFEPGDTRTVPLVFYARSGEIDPAWSAAP